MYSIKAHTGLELLEIETHGDIDEGKLTVMLDEIEQARKQFKYGYKLLIVIHEDLKHAAGPDQLKQIGSNVSRGKMEGLKQVVIQEPNQSSAYTRNIVLLLLKLYAHFKVPVDVSEDMSTSLRLLNL